jgi:hypothetical protein
MDGENVSTAWKIFWSLLILTVCVLIGGFIYRLMNKKPDYPPVIDEPYENQQDVSIVDKSLEPQGREKISSKFDKR